MNKQFRINMYITLKLENNNSFIYVNKQKFKQCKYLLIDIPIEEVGKYDNVGSIDRFVYADINEYESYPTDNIFFV